MTPNQFRVTEAKGESPPVVSARGDIDLANVAEFQEALTRAAHDTRALTVDLAEVQYCDSAALRALFSVAASVKLTLKVRAGGPVTVLLGISGLDRVATVETVD